MRWNFLNNILCMKNWSIVYAHHQQKNGWFVHWYIFRKQKPTLMIWDSLQTISIWFDLMQFTANLFTQKPIYFKSTSINKADRSKNRVFLTEIHTKLNTNWFQKKKNIELKLDAKHTLVGLVYRWNWFKYFQSEFLIHHNFMK